LHLVIEPELLAANGAGQSAVVAAARLLLRNIPFLQTRDHGTRKIE
jgi:hypothetical protein